MTPAVPAATIADGASGPDVIAAVETAARAAGMSPYAYLRPFNKNPSNWLRTLVPVKRCTPATIARIRTFLAGEPLPPEPTRPPRGVYRTREERAAIADAREPVIVPPVVDRDPCFRCGVRADVGCRHRRPSC